MKLDVPFYAQKGMECGQTSLKMVLEYFGIRKTTEEISEKALPEKGGNVWTMGLAKAAHEFGLKVTFFTISLHTSREKYSHLDFYQKHTSDESSKIISQIIDYLRRNEIKIEEKSLTIDELLSFVGDNSLPIVLIDWSIVTGKSGYTGHIVPVVGYDDEYVYIHQPSKPSQAYMKIKKDIFDKARKAEGTDDDVVVVHR